jgi:hypothetical protein
VLPSGIKFIGDSFTLSWSVQKSIDYFLVVLVKAKIKHRESEMVGYFESQEAFDDLK